MTYRVEQTQVPPTLVERDGKWFIQVHHGTITTEAPIGPWFVAQLMTRVVLTQLVLDAHDTPNV